MSSQDACRSAMAAVKNEQKNAVRKMKGIVIRN